MPVAVILNPSAGRGRAGRLWDQWRSDIEGVLGPCEVFRSAAPREAMALTRAAILGGHTRIISAGGDGTHFEVLNGCMDGDSPINPDVTVAYLPLGSGADFTRSLHVHRSRESVLQLLGDWNAKPMDIVRVELTGFDGQPASFVFQNIARAGIGADVVARAERSQKRLGGFYTFMVSTVQSILTYRHKPVRIEMNGALIEQRFMELVVANGMFDGGGMRTAPHAVLDDAQLEVYLYGRISLGDALGSLYRIYVGTMMDRPDVVQYHQAKTLHAESSERVLLEADGEMLGTLPARFTVLPLATRAVFGAPSKA